MLIEKRTVRPGPRYSTLRNRFVRFAVPSSTTSNEGGSSVSILWIILIIVLVLLLLGFFSRGRW
jgi:hypothetical protein